MIKTECSDKEIVDLFWQRNEDAISILDHKYGMNLNLISRRILNNKEDAEECVNDAYYKTWSTIPDERPVYIFYYVGKIVRNLSINKLKMKKAGKRSFDNEFSLCITELEDCISSRENVESHVEFQELSGLITEYLKQIKKPHMVMFVERYWHMKTIKDIAHMHKMTEKKVEMILYRCRKNLKNYLEERGYTV